LSFCKTIGKRQITEFNYRYADTQRAQVFVGVELTRGDEERAELIERLTDKHFKVLDMTDNETAKQHIRFMVGGHAPSIDAETLIRFEFPERPGALLDFLTALGKRWNISLFHYRNHGAAYGRVLMGAQIPPLEQQDFHHSLDALGYRYFDETGNPAYQIFAGSSESHSGQ
jgi:threonine dehydratase